MTNMKEARDVCKCVHTIIINTCRHIPHRVRGSLFGAAAELIYYKYTHHILCNSMHKLHYNLFVTLQREWKHSMDWSVGKMFFKLIGR